MNTTGKYSGRGVSSEKEDVHNAIRNIDKGIFPNAFCKVMADDAGGDEAWCSVMHADGAGTKSSLAYLYWKETGDLGVWHGIAQDAIVMNTDDLLCVGITDNILLSSTIGRNKYLIPGEVIATVIGGTQAFLGRMQEQGIGIRLTGGETADVGDLVRTIIVDSTVYARIRREQVIRNDNIRAGDVIVGLASFGQTTYETEYNSGIGSNGLTSARHDVLHRSYGERYPESHDPAMPPHLLYAGDKRLSDPSGVEGMDVGRLLLSPTRTYAPVVREILREHRGHIHGMVHCSGGGQTKVLHFIDRLRVVKDNLFEIPPVFRLIREQSGTDLQEMLRVFNMGHRMEIYLPESFASSIIKLCSAFNLDARVVGHCEDAGSKSVCIRHDGNTYEYR
jgi:phosphoribosylformylglycinamidine cyclo-ligase